MKTLTRLAVFLAAAITTLGADPFVISTSTNRLTTRDSMFVSWNIGTNEVEFSDRIQLYLFNTPSNSAPTREYDFAYSRSRTKSKKIYIDLPGEYEFRYVRVSGFFRNRWIDLGKSGKITVSNPVTQPTLVQNWPPPNNLIVAYGDSLTFGLGADEINLDNGDPTDASYPSELSRRLGGKVVVNLGKTGDTSADGLARYDTDVKPLNPGIVCSLFGGNDILRNVSTNTTYQNLTGIVQKIHSQGAVCVLIGIGNTGTRYGDRLEDVYRRVASEQNCVYIPNVLRNILGDYRLVSDAVHPNGEGYKFMAKRIAPSVALLLNPAQGTTITRDGSQFRLGLELVPGVRYNILEANNLPDWQPIAEVTGEGSVQILLRPKQQSSFIHVTPATAKEKLPLASEPDTD